MKALWSSTFCHKVYNLYSWLTCFSFFPSAFSIWFFFQTLVSFECHCVFFFSSLYIPSNVSELLQYFLPCIWLFLLLCWKAFGKFWVFQWFWRLGHLFSSSSLQSWMLFSQGVFITALQSFTLSSVSYCNLWGLSAGRSLCLMLLVPEVWAAL